MNASYPEKSAWVQLVAMALVFGGYFAIAASMRASGVTALAAFVPLFAVSVVLLVVVLVVGHIAAALTGRPQHADERDRLIGWRAEAGASWLLAAGVLASITAMLFAVDAFWIAHGLFAALLASELLKLALQIAFYRRGV